MIRLDSTTFVLPLSEISLKKDYFIKSTETVLNDENTVISSNLKLKKEVAKNILGLSNIKANEDKNIVELTVSSKILKGDYYDMINKNTVGQLIRELNSTGIVKVSEQSFIERGGVYKADTTMNLELTENLELSSMFSALSSIPLTDKYNVKLYNTSGNRGVVFSGTQKTFKERMIFYDKSKDIFRDKKLQRHVPYEKLYNQFLDTLRVESNFTSFAKLREYTGATDIFVGNQKVPSIKSVLLSDKNPNLSVFNKITKKLNTIDLMLFKEWDGMRFYEVEKQEGRKSLIRLFNYDMVQISAFIHSRVRGNASKYVRQYRKILHHMNIEESGNPHQNIIEVLQSLMVKAA